MVEAGTGIEPVYSDLQSKALSGEINRLGAKSYQDKPGTLGEPDTRVFGAHPPNENPGALAGATGANGIRHFTTPAYRNRAIAATALCSAIADCDPGDACTIMAAALADLGGGMGSPLPVFETPLADARWWAGYASPAELKAYALACYDAMRPKVQAAFLAHVQRGAVA